VVVHLRGEEHCEHHHEAHQIIHIGPIVLDGPHIHIPRHTAQGNRKTKKGHITTYKLIPHADDTGELAVEIANDGDLDGDDKHGQQGVPVLPKDEASGIGTAVGGGGRGGEKGGGGGGGLTRGGGGSDSKLVSFLGKGSFLLILSPIISLLPPETLLLLIFLFLPTQSSSSITELTYHNYSI